MNQYIFTSHTNRDWSKLAQLCEKNKKIDPNVHRYSFSSGGFYTYCMEPEQFYDWHSDSFYLNGRYSGRRWARIIYLTYGAPIQFGRWDWSCKNGKIDYLDTGGWPIPERVEHSVDIYPGLEIRFPSFFLHRVPYISSVKNNRWAIVHLDTDHRDENEKDLFEQALTEYIKK
jgi:hypothetical protein